jgi:ubiquinone biosynthesis protein Coq4
VRRRTLERRDILGALRAGARWLVNPVSEGGAKQVPRMALLATGPDILVKLERMREHPDGRRVLADRPHLGAALTDMEALARLPVGSFGRAFRDYMDHPEGIPGYLLAGLIYADGFLDSFDLTDEQRYVLDRNMWLHDMLHVLTGYGADLTGEALLSFFDLGYEVGLSHRRALATPFGLGPRLLLRPSCGAKRWCELMRDASERGLGARRACPPEQVYWEELLPQPLTDVRRRLGIDAFEIDTSAWLDHDTLGRLAATGFGAYPRMVRRAQLARRVVESGIPYRDYLRAPPRVARRLRALAAEGADGATLRAALR